MTTKIIMKGEREQSYMISIARGCSYQALKTIAFNRYNQDAVLRVTAYGGARLSHNDGSLTLLGAFKQVDTIPADQCYTQSFKTGNIYVTV